MVDVSSMSTLLYEAIRAQREQEIAQRSWLRRLRAIEQRERTVARERKVIVNSPAHLAGVHKL
jgi:hypothetical protein